MKVGNVEDLKVTLLHRHRPGVASMNLVLEILPMFCRTCFSECISLLATFAGVDVAEELEMPAKSVRQAKYMVLKRLRLELGETA